MLQDILSTLSSRYGDFFPGMTGPPRIISTSVEHRRLSDLVRVKLQQDGSSTEIFVKFHKHPHSPDARVRAKAEREFETLKWLCEAFASVPGCSVVRPVAYFSDFKAVVTEKVDGTELHTLLNRPLQSLLGFNRKKTEKWCYEAGRWLRKFQELTARPEKEKFDTDRFRGEVEGSIRSCEALGFSSLLARRVLSWVQAELDQVGKPMVDVVGQHPDFQPQNILVTPQGITVLDFTSFKYGSRYHDVACFLSFLDSRAKHPFFSKARIDCLRQSFFRGYRLLSCHDPLLRLHRLKAMLTYSATLLGRIGGSTGSQSIMHRFLLRWSEKEAIPEVLSENKS